MTATFTYAAVYTVRAVCQSPLRTAGADGETETVLRDRNGTAMVQGSSLAGALRGWLCRSDKSALETRLFGSQTFAGHLIVSDGVFDKAAAQQMRPRLAIQGSTGSAKDGGKFDVAQMAAGSELTFSLTWLGTPEAAAAELPCVEQLLAALNDGQITLGAQKTNGFGRVALTVRKRTFDLCEPADRAAWLADNWDGEPLPLLSCPATPQTVFRVVGRAENLLVRAAAPMPWKENRSYMANLRENGTDILPASSVKGAVRARAAVIADTLGLPEAFLDALFGRADNGEDLGLAGRVQFADARLSGGQKQKISRIRIDRFTGGVMRSGPFTEEPLCSDVTLEIKAPAEDAACGLLLYTLRDLGLGLFSLGSGSAIGRGQITVREVQVLSPDGRQAKLLFDDQRRCRMEDPAALLAEFLNALEVATHEN
jgi:CRISPR/Cas system CSM-associated protein Csm3 (group 7 of RAMP superfamily)